MQWVCFIEIQGLYAGVALAAGLVPAGSQVVVLQKGVVCDGCREAFAGGLQQGAPARQVLRDAPRAKHVELAQVDAAATARSWWERCLARTPYVEPVELHQVYLALPFPESSITEAVRSEVKGLVDQAAAYGFVAFAGVASSKLVARAAALSCKENWLLRRPGARGRLSAPTVVEFVPPGAEERFLAPLSLSYLPAPPELQRRLARLGMRTIGEAARIPEGEWLRQLGPLGRQVAVWSHGVDSEQVKPCYPPRALERRTLFAPEVRERAPLEQTAGRSAALLAARLAAQGEGCQQVGLTLERAGQPPVRTARTLARLQQAAYPLQQALALLLDEALRDGQAESEVAYTALTVELSMIGPLPWQQLDLWADQARFEREERIQRALSLLHERFPVRMVGLGAGRGESWREQMLRFSDPYRWAAEGG